ncbi:DNA sulfur modification protein DndD [Weeksellaceae bacterium TAE3-ERU29]|nr:DNA sulfur modification protein DndD [Weeksellaceae bacterium TAE3-ERU29]
MKIKEITFENFKIYHGKNTIKLKVNDEKNINLICGKNGYGKTTFLTALIWLFYGKMMAQVEEKYRIDIKKAGGYAKYVESLLNNTTRSTPGSKTFSVTVKLVDINIPSIPCKSITIRRAYNLHKDEESLNVLIDDQVSELTQQVGFEIFINDFILPREIAKFFFFDAEKIVSLAEAKSKSELKSLNKAYTEVLGIKKYDDLKSNLQALLTKLRRDGANEYEKEELERLLKIEKDYSIKIESLEDSKAELEEEVKRLSAESDELQEQLIREGSNITVDELKSLKEEKEKLEEENNKVKSELKKFYDILPFVISENLTKKLYNQVVLEKQGQNSKIINDKKNEALINFCKELKSNIDKIEGDDLTKSKIINDLDTLLQKNTTSEKLKDVKILLNLSESSTKEFETLYHYLKSSFQLQFEAITREDKDIKTKVNIIRSKIKQGEARKNNALNKQLLDDRNSIESKINEYKSEIEKYIAEIAENNLKRSNNLKILSEYEKNFQFSELARKKYDVTEKLLDKVKLMITRIKEEKKYTLQKSILRELKRLFHKKNFIEDVNVKINESYMDIELINKDNEVIEKNDLSKGEQQLYATAILKALVDESGIEFPVFIDSPLQKLDPDHSQNVISEFYPNVSKQVVIFPLLEKELNELEYQLLLPNLSKTYLIENNDKNGSSLVEHSKENIFDIFKKQLDVYAN